MAKRQHKKKKATSTTRVGELATPERRCKQGGVTTEIVDRDATGKATIKRHRARLECMLDAHLLSGEISIPQYKAGMKFRKNFLRVNNDRHGSALADTASIGGRRDGAEWKMIAHIDSMRCLRVARDLLTPMQQIVIRTVCGYDKYVYTVSEKKAFLQALDILAAHWGYA